MYGYSKWYDIVIRAVKMNALTYAIILFQFNTLKIFNLKYTIDFFFNTFF